MACKSAWMPAPPPESDPAMVYTMGGGMAFIFILLAALAAFVFVVDLDVGVEADNPMAESRQKDDRRHRKVPVVMKCIEYEISTWPTKRWVDNCTQR